MYTYFTLFNIFVGRNMAVSYFIYVTDKENTGFDLEKFNNDIKQRFPKVGILVKDDEKYRYNICWEDYEDEYEFELWMLRDRSVFMINYFNSKNRLYDYAKYIIWLRSYFPYEKEVLLCDEGYNKTIVLSEGVEIEDILEMPE